MKKKIWVLSFFRELRCCFFLRYLRHTIFPVLHSKFRHQLTASAWHDCSQIRERNKPFWGIKAEASGGDFEASAKKDWWLLHIAMIVTWEYSRVPKCPVGRYPNIDKARKNIRNLIISEPFRKKMRLRSRMWIYEDEDCLLPVQIPQIFILLIYNFSLFILTKLTFYNNSFENWKYFLRQMIFLFLPFFTSHRSQSSRVWRRFSSSSSHIRQSWNILFALVFGVPKSPFLLLTVVLFMTRCFILFVESEQYYSFKVALRSY